MLSFNLNGENVRQLLSLFNIFCNFCNFTPQLSSLPLIKAVQ